MTSSRGGRLTAALLFGTLLLANSLTLQAASVNKEGVGEPVGVFKRITCPAHTYLVGLKTVVNFWLDFVRIYCAGTDSSGAWTTTAAPPVSGSFILRGWGFDPNQVDIILANTHMLECPLDTYVTGLNPGLATVTKPDGTHMLPWHTMTECRNWKTRLTTSDTYPALQWGSDPDVSGTLLGWDGVGGLRSCKDTEVGIGVWAMVGDNFHKFGLVCDDFSTVEPARLPLEVIQHVLPKASNLNAAAKLFSHTSIPLKGVIPINDERAKYSTESAAVELCKRKPWLCH